MPTSFISLVAEENDSLQQMTSGLKGLGFPVRSFHTLRSILETAFSEPPALMIFDLDLDFPQIQKLLTFLGQQDKIRTIPVVIVTAESQHARLSRARKGTLACVSKPLIFSELVASIRSLLRENNCHALLEQSQRDAHENAYPSSPHVPANHSPHPQAETLESGTAPLEETHLKSVSDLRLEEDAQDQGLPAPLSGAEAETTEAGAANQSNRPLIYAVNPPLLEQQDGDIEITVNGDGFISSLEATEITGKEFTPASQILLDGQALPTLFYSSTQLKAFIPKGFLANSKSGVVQVLSSAPHSDTSEPFKIDVAHPLPKLESIEPKELESHSSPERITLRGSGFIPQSMVYVEDELLAVDYQGPDLLQVEIPTTLNLKPGQINIQVYNPEPGGGVSQTQCIQYRAIKPELKSLEPQSIPACARTYQVDLDSQAKSLTLRAKGTGFVTGSVVYFNGTALETEYLSPTELSAEIPVSLVRESGNVPITILYPSENGLKLTNSRQFQVHSPLPIIREVDPPHLELGFEEAEIRISGLYFTSGCTVRAGGEERIPLRVNPTEIVCTLSGSQIIDSEAIELFVENPEESHGRSNRVLVPVQYPAPELSGISIEKAIAGQDDLSFELYGDGFFQHSQVLLNHTHIPSILVSPKVLRATIPAEFLLESGEHDVLVRNPEPGGGRSGGIHFSVVNPQPQLSTLNPDTIDIQERESLEILMSGHDFVPTSTVRINDACFPSIFVDSEHLNLPFPKSLLEKSQALRFCVVNPEPGGGMSAELKFEICNPKPILNDITPTTIESAWKSHRCLVSGKNFGAGSKAFFDGEEVPTRLVDGDTLELLLGPRESAQPGHHSLLITNPPPGGGDSRTCPFTINHPTPKLSYISPMSCEVGSAPPVLEIHGVSLAPGAMILINGTACMTQYVNPTTLFTPLQKDDVEHAGKLTISLANPEPGSGISDSQEFLIFNPVPQIETIDIEESSADYDEFQITIHGTNFNESSRISLGEYILDPVLLERERLVLLLAKDLLSGDDYVSISIWNPEPGGGSAEVAVPIPPEKVPEESSKVAEEAPDRVHQDWQDEAVIDVLNQ